ncbi:hypothetical protein [Paraburkholderia aspalathi]|uniref:Uncharacterized protein n=1 Tax=Paraburkholderia aspalathi TaxID=1324617 RepID=A0A1I7B9P3_9BURK|nr:hypothetical protein [Paraburkholderia aspalathi]SFT83919.1 hypothetical protein SAMN05192563_1004303 [Paraburkholderia aspalathi]
MARLRIILLYFVLPVFLFAAFVLYQVGAQHFGVAMVLAGAMVFIIWSWIRTTPSERAEAQRVDEEARYLQEQEWASYYASHQQDHHH